MTPEEVKRETPRLVTRIFITETGDVVVTDLWEEVREAILTEEKGFCEGKS